MRVKFVSTYPPANCGIAAYSWHYVEALRKLCDVEVVPIERPKMSPFYFVGLALKARKGADIVHVQFDCGFFGTFGRGRLSLSGMYVPLFYLILKLPGGPRVVTTIHELHDAEKDYGGRLLHWPIRAYYTMVYRPMTALSDIVLAHTEDTIRALSQYGPTGKAAILPHASFVEPVFLPQENCKSKLGLAGKRVVTMFGYVSRSKGHDLAIEAIKEMPDDVVLYIAGDGRTVEDKNYLSMLKESVIREELGDRIKFYGYVPDADIPIVMCASDVVLMPYRHVVQSGAVNYALAYFKPVLASDMGGFAEISRNYECIITFEPGEIKDLEKKLRDLLTDISLADRLGLKAREYISSINMERIALRTYETYLKVTGKAGGDT
jgi:glycosyltransferase involved in cell wall biosynthesis